MNIFVAMKEHLLNMHEVNRVDVGRIFVGTPNSIMRTER